MRPVLALLLLVFMSACSSEQGDGGDDVDILSETLLEEIWSTPVDDIDEAFLLVRAYDFVPDDQGNLIVLDENRLKVFRPGGIPWKVVGREGQGPGEFSFATGLEMSETGILTVRTGGGGPSHSHFSPGLEFISRDDYRNENPCQGLGWDEDLYWDRPEGMVLYDMTHRFYRVTARPREAPFGQDRIYHLFYETPDSLYTLASYRWDNMLAGSRMGMTLPFLGDLFAAPLPGRRVVFTHTGVDRSREGEDARYVLHLVDLSTMEHRRIEHVYDPLPVGVQDVEDRLVDPEDFDDENNQRIYREMNEALTEGIKEYTEKGPLMGLFADGNRIFAVTYTLRDTTHALTDVFDAESGAYLLSAWVPVTPFDLPAIRRIRDGFAYGRNDSQITGEDPRIICYRVNPRIYR